MTGNRHPISESLFKFGRTRPWFLRIHNVQRNEAYVGPNVMPAVDFNLRSWRANLKNLKSVNTTAFILAGVGINDLVDD